MAQTWAPKFGSGRAKASLSLLPNFQTDGSPQPFVLNWAPDHSTQDWAGLALAPGPNPRVGDREGVLPGWQGPISACEGGSARTPQVSQNGSQH